MQAQITTERPAPALSGAGMLLLNVVLLGAGLATLIPVPALGVALILAGALALPGYVINPPNEARVLVLFGKYAGTIREAGWFWVNPLTANSRISISTKVRNFDSQKIKVNDANGNPVEIAAVVVWRVIDTARASFDVEDYVKFVGLQAETAVRHVASQFPYDSYEDGAHSLSGNADEVCASLKTELGERLPHVGVDVVEARLSHLSYAPEIAGAMLRRQQASAIVAARQKMVEGAVGMVQMALDMLSRENIVDLDNERKASMVSNLLVVLTGEQGAQPVVNAGSIY